MRLLAVLNTLLELYKLLLLIYFVVALLRVPSNRWTTLLARVIEPVVNPVRTFLRTRLPARWQMVDWSLVAVYLLISVAQSVLQGLWRSFLLW